MAWRDLLGGLSASPDWVTGIDDKIEYERIKALMEAQTAITAGYGANTPEPSYNSASLKNMIASRMRWSHRAGEFPPSGKFDFLECHKANEEKVIVFAVINGSAVTIEDEWPLFPSDKLITQLRVLEG